MFVAAEVWTIVRTESGHAVLVRPLGSDRAVPIVIGNFEVQSIILGQTGILGLKDSINRPMTHDLMLHLIHDLHGRVVQVEIHTLNEGIFYANIILEQNGARTEVDSRPSDALALAIRARCPIYIDDSIVEIAGIPASTVQENQNQDEDEESQGRTEIENEMAYEEDDPSDAVVFDDNFEDIERESEDDLDLMSRNELEKRLKHCVENELYEEAAKIRDLLKKFD